MSLIPALSLVAVAVIVAYLLVGNIWHRVVSPLPTPDPSTFPVTGDQLVGPFKRSVQGL
jgi:hypothetical protein